MNYFCCNNYSEIENYELAKADNFKGWVLHHRLGTHNSDGEKRLVNLSKDELIALDMYYNRPADELIFLTRAGHCAIHNYGHKRYEGAGHFIPHTEQSKQLIREHKSHKVLCIETDEVFSSIKEANLKYHTSHISHVVTGDRKTAAGFHWELVPDGE